MMHLFFLRNHLSSNSIFSGREIMPAERKADPRPLWGHAFIMSSPMQPPKQHPARAVRPAERKADPLWLLVTVAAITNAVMQPLRVCVNFAAENPNPYRTFRAAFWRLYSAMPLNVLRGAASLFLQTVAKDRLELRFEEGSVKGKLAGLGGATAAGVAVGVTLERWFVLNNQRKKDALKNVPKDALAECKSAPVASKGIAVARPRISLALLIWLSLREFGFCAAVLYAKELAELQKQAVMLGSGVVTAFAHKQVVPHMLGTHGEPVLRPDGKTVVPPSRVLANCIFWRLGYLKTYGEVRNRVISGVEPYVDGIEKSMKKFGGY
jgi:hypothetical protein